MGFVGMTTKGTWQPVRGAGLLAIPLALVAACTVRTADEGWADDPEAVLWGGQKCASAAECPTGLCTMAMCVGYLAASTEEARDTAAPALKAMASSPQADALARMLVEVASDPASDAFLRGRAADAFRHLPAAVAIRELPPLLDDPDEPVRFFAARALWVAGDPRGRSVLQAFLQHPSEAVRAFAGRALGPG